jgi:hypothetical protein
MKNIIVVIIFCVTNIALAQNKNIIYSGSKTYESTPTWSFELNSGYGSLDLAIGKNKKEGVLLLTIGTISKQTYLKGIVLLFLEDGSVIKCYDKGIKDYLDGRSMSLYNLTANEVKTLMKKRIVRVRFSLYNYGYESLSADNKKNTIFFNSKEKPYDETDIEVWDLFYDEYVEDE